MFAGSRRLEETPVGLPARSTRIRTGRPHQLDNGGFVGRVSVHAKHLAVRKELTTVGDPLSLDALAGPWDWAEAITELGSLNLACAASDVTDGSEVPVILGQPIHTGLRPARFFPGVHSPPLVHNLQGGQYGGFMRFVLVSSLIVGLVGFGAFACSSGSSPQTGEDQAVKAKDGVPAPTPRRLQTACVSGDRLNEVACKNTVDQGAQCADGFHEETSNVTSSQGGQPIDSHECVLTPECDNAPCEKGYGDCVERGDRKRCKVAAMACPNADGKYLDYCSGDSCGGDFYLLSASKEVFCKYGCTTDCLAGDACCRPPPQSGQNPDGPPQP
jgi:hypothetical protein